MQKRSQNVLLGAFASGAFAFSLPLGEMILPCLRGPCTPELLAQQWPTIFLSVSIALVVFYLGSRLGRIRSGWLAALLLCSSRAWAEATHGPPTALLLTLFVTLCGGLPLLRSSTRGAQVPTPQKKSALLLVWGIPWFILVLGFNWLAANETGVAAPGDRTLALTGLMPWVLLTIPLAFWIKEAQPLTNTMWMLLFWAGGGFLFFSLMRVTPQLPWLPAFPALALLGGLILGPGPEGRFPRRLVRLNLEIVAAAGIVTAFLLLSAMVSPLESLLPSTIGGPWLPTLAALRTHGTLSMLLAFGILSLSILVIWQARGSHWLRASLPLALLLAILRGLLQ